MSVEDASDAADDGQVEEQPEPDAEAERSDATRGQPRLRVEGIHKNFGRVVALRDVSFSIRDNEILAMIGDNGAGKSTMMNILSGVYRPSEGEIYDRGEPVSFDSPEDARSHGIETVYQDLALMDDLDVATNVFMGQFPTRGFGPAGVIDWAETYERTGQILSETLKRGDIDPHKEVEFLSGGERQLVAIARALAFDPDLVILDEPTSALSVEATRLVHNTIDRLKAEGHTVIIVSHNLEEVMGMADRIAVLHQGQLADVVDPDDVDEEVLSNLIVAGRRER